MRTFTFSACLLSALLGSASAFAENGAANSVSYTWTGLYGGINTGYGWGSSDWDFAGGQGSNSHNDSSGVIGIQFGFDAQLSDHWFAGVEADLDASRIDGQSGCFNHRSCETHVSSLGDVAARVGITQGQSLFYLKGGIAYEDATHHILTATQDFNDGGGAVYGYVIGGGAEYALTYNLTTKIEYNYLDFGSQDYTIEPGNTAVKVKEPINLVKIGLNMKFD